MRIWVKYLFPAVSAALLFLGPWVASAAETGESTFKARCAVCHGADGSGHTGMGKMFKLRDLKSPEVQKMTDAQLTELISRGKGRMPAFEASLGKEKIQAVVGYLRELAKKK